jgi:hypothetical protein
VSVLADVKDAKSFGHLYTVRLYFLYMTKMGSSDQKRVHGFIQLERCTLSVAYDHRWPTRDRPTLRVERTTLILFVGRIDTDNILEIANSR